jgi:hypothetical protein
LAKVDPDLFQNLFNHFVALLFHANVHGIIYCVVHHLLSLLHDVVLTLKLHGDPLEGRKIHRAVHAAESLSGALHGLHHLFVCSVRLEPKRDLL